MSQMTANHSLQQQESLAHKVFSWVLVAFLIYVLISSVAMIGEGFQTTNRERFEGLFQFVSNPFMGLVIGILATAMVQSSSTVTSIIVGLVAGGLPVETAIPMVMGADFGTTVTNTIVSLGFVGKKNYFRRAFAAATVHDFFNLLAVVIFLPLELIFHPLEKAAGALSVLLVGGEDMSIKGFDFVASITSYYIDIFKTLILWITENGSGILLIIFGIIAILFTIVFLGRLLRRMMVGRARSIMNTALGNGPLRGIFSGALVTVLVQSSSTTTSLMVPFAGAGVFRLKQVYPFTLGANMGTTVKSLLAATAITGATAQYALQIALVFLLYNCLSVVLVYSIPALRKLPMRGAAAIAKVASKNRLIALFYVLGVFFGLPGLLIFLSLWF